jgi:hypothetical protein
VNASVKNNSGRAYQRVGIDRTFFDGGRAVDTRGFLISDLQPGETGYGRQSSRRPADDVKCRVGFSQR